MLVFCTFIHSSNLVPHHKSDHLALLNQLFREIFSHFSRLNLEAIILFRYLVFNFRILVKYYRIDNPRDKFFRDVHDMSLKLFEQILTFLSKYVNEKNMTKILISKDVPLTISEVSKFIDDKFILEVKNSIFYIRV